jgi:hypothetical protein
MLKRFIVLTAFIFAVAGCGSSSSSVSTANNGTGSLAATLTWPANGAQQKSVTTTKTLYAAPAGVENIQIVVLNSNRVSLASKTFAANLNSGTIEAIPAGSGYTVEIRGLVAGFIQKYERIVKNITINAGEVTNLGEITMFPITTASPPGGSYGSPQSVTLTNSEAVTIYYTTSATNGADPTINSPVYGNTPISISGHVFLKFFAVYPGNILEAIRTGEYTTP